MISFQAEKRKQVSFFKKKIKSHHADLTIAYKPSVYTSHLRRGLYLRRLIPQRAYTSEGLYPRRLIPQRAYSRDRESASKQTIAELIKIRFVLQNVIINQITRGVGGKHWS